MYNGTYSCMKRSGGVEMVTYLQGMEICDQVYGGWRRIVL